jgi:hypothetical protein
MADKKTKAGSMDDDATKRAKKNKKKKEALLRALFEDNDTGRYSGAIDD